MYVLCILAVLTFHSLLRKRVGTRPDRTSEAAGMEKMVLEVLEVGVGSAGRRRVRGTETLSSNRRRVQVRSRTGLGMKPGAV